MHRRKPSLEICGKYLANSGKLARIGGLNIVNFTKSAGFGILLVT